jgi:hypothetical protein
MRTRVHTEARSTGWVFGRTVLVLALGGGVLFAGAAPEVEIVNGFVRATIALPDAGNGLYRGTRFDWSGVITSLESQGHTYFGRWYKAHDPALRDVEFRADLDGFAAGTPSAATGPVEEFSNPLGFVEAPAGGTFAKIGVGILRKPDEAKYAWSTRYEIVDPGTWSVRPRRDAVEFEQAIGTGSAYGYRYRKTVRLSKGKAELVLEHSLENTGRRVIETPVYAHNFLVIDGQPSGPDFAITVPFEVREAADTLGILRARGREVAFLREPDKDERAMVSVAGFGNDPKDFDIRVENRRTGAGVRITADRPVARLVVWAIRPTRCPEAFIDVRLEPGREFTWRITYEFYELQKTGGEVPDLCHGWLVGTPSVR